MRKKFTIVFTAIPGHPGASGVKDLKLQITAGTLSDALRIAKSAVWEKYNWLHFGCMTDGSRAGDPVPAEAKPA